MYLKRTSLDEFFRDLDRRDRQLRYAFEQGYPLDRAILRAGLSNITDRPHALRLWESWSRSKDASCAA